MTSGSTTEPDVLTAEQARLGAPRLLAGVRRDRALTFAEHQEVHGPLPSLERRWTRATSRSLIDELTAAGIGGRGGAGFPFARKLAAVAGQRRRPFVVVNAAESEPAAHKDAALATLTPHLVLDGAVVSARLVGARDVIVWTHRGESAVSAAFRRALAQ